MTLYQGWTPEPNTLTRCKNLAQIVIRHAGAGKAAELVGNLVGKHGDITPGFEHDLTALARSCLGTGTNEETTNAMLARREALCDALENDEFLSPERAEDIANELSNIEASIDSPLTRPEQAERLLDTLEVETPSWRQQSHAAGYGDFGPM